MRLFLTTVLILAATSLSAQVPTSGLRVHLKADAGTSTTTENAVVTSWTDQSGNGFSATAPAGQPVYQSNAINGMPALFFNGAQYLHIANTSALGLVNSDYEMFFVAKSSSSTIQFLASGGIEEHEVHLNGMGGLRYIPKSLNGINHGPNGAYTDGAARIFGVRTTSTVGSVRVNGVDVSLPHNYQSSTDAMFRLGIRGSGDYPLIGHIAEVIIYNRVLSKYERNQVETYLAQKYGVADPAPSAPIVALDSPEISLLAGTTFSGTVNPNGLATTYRFLYGIDEDQLTMSTEPTSVGSGSSAVAVSASIPGLAPGQTYYVALVAENVSQLTKTSTQAFTVTTRPTGTPTLALPADGLKLHLKSDVGLSTTTELQGVTEWSDVSGNGRNATMVVEAARPIFRGSALNGGPAVQFTDSRWMLLTNPSTIGLLNSDYEMFFVAKSGNPAIQFLVSGTVPNYELHLNGASGQRFIPRDGVFVDVGTNGQFTNNVPRIFSGRASGSSSVSRVNGVETQAALSGLTSADGQLRLGIRSDASYPFYGEMAEVLFYNRTLSDQERARVEHYLAQKYAIAAGNLVLPTASINAATTTQDLTASFSGMANPNGVATSVRFAYGTDPDNLSQWTDAVSIGSGTSSVPVSASVSGLSRFQTYYVKLIASTEFESVESSSTSFTTDYVEVASAGVSIAVQDDETVIFVNADLTVPTETGSEYRILVGSFETDFAPADDASGTFTIERFLPNDDLEFATTYDVTVIARSPSGKLTYGDTLSIRYVGIPTAQLTSLTPLQTGEVIVSGSLNPNGSNTSYLIRYGTDPDDLAQSTSAVSIGDGIATVSITDTLALSTGETYWVSLVGTDGDDLIGRSDTLSVSTSFATAFIDSVTVARDSDITFHGRVNPTSLETSIRYRYGSSRSALDQATDWESIALIDIVGGVPRGIPMLPFGGQYYVVLEADNGENIARSDTVAFDTKFVEINFFSLMLSEETTPQIQVHLSVNTFDATGAEYRILYGTDAEVLTPLTAFTAIEQDDPLHTLTEITPVPGTIYYLQIEARGASGKTTFGIVRSIRYSTPPTAVLHSITPSEDLTASFDGSVNPNGGVVSYSLYYGTDPNNLDQATIMEWLPTSDSSPVSVSGSISGLTAGATYYAELRAYNDNHSTQTSDRLMFDTKFVAVESFELSLTAAPTPQISASIGIDTFNASGVEYRLLFGTQSTNLEPVGDFQALAAESFTASISGNDLTPGATYYAAVEARSASARTAISSTESIRFAGFPIAVLDSITTTQNLTARFDGKINPNGGNVSYVVQFGTERNNLNQTSASVSVETNGTTQVAEWTSLSDLAPGSIYYATLAVTNGNYPTQRSDTLAFDMRYATVEYFNPDVESPTDVRVYMGMNPHGSAKSGTIRFGADPDNLNRSVTDPVSYTGTSTVSRTSLVNLFSPDSSYYAQWVIDDLNGGPTTISDVVSFNTIFPTVSIDSVFSTGNNALAVRATVDTKNQNVTLNARVAEDGGSFSTQDPGVTVSGNSNPVSVMIPLQSLSTFEDYLVAIEATNTSGNTATSDTTAFDTDFVQLYAASASLSGQNVALFAVSQGRPNVAFDYRILQGTHRDSLNPISAFESVSSPDGYVQVRDTLAGNGFTPGSTYSFAIEGRGASGWISRSDTVNLTYRALAYATRPVALIDSIVFGFSDIPVTLGSTIYPNGRNVSYQFWVGTHPDSLVAQGTASDVASSVDSLVASLPLTQVERFKEYFVAVSVLEQGQPTASRTDTISFSTDVPYLYAYDAYAFIDFEDDGHPIMGTLRAYVDTGDLDTYARVMYGTHPDSLILSTTPQRLPSMDDQEQIDADVVFGPLQPNTTYYARMELSNASNTASTYDYTLGTTFPGIALGSIQIYQEGGAYIQGTITRNGLSGQYGIRYGTHPDSLNLEDTPRYFSNSDNDTFDAGFTLSNLTLGKTYYASLYASSGHSQFNRTRVFTMNLLLPSVDSSAVTTRPDLTASVDALIDTKGQDVAFWVETYRMASSSWAYSDTLTVAGSATSVPVTVDLGSFDRSSGNVLVLALQAPNGPVVYADTTLFNFNYAVIEDAAIARNVVDDETFLDITANLSVEDGTLASYRVYFGEAGGALSPLSDAVAIQPASSSHSVSVSVGPDDLVVGTTYAAMIEAISLDGKSTLSDTVSVSYGTRPEITDFQIATASDLSASFTASMVSNNTAGSYRVVYGNSPENLYAATDAASFDEDISVDAIIGTFSRASAWYAALEVVTDSYSTVRSEPISFNLNYPTIQFSQYPPTITGENKIFLSVGGENFNLTSSLFVNYGYSNHVDSLMYDGTEFELDASAQPISWYVAMGPVIRNDTVYYRVGHSIGDKTTWSDIRSIYAIGHTFTVDTPILTPTGNGKFRAVVKAVMDPKGMSSSVREFIATLPDFSDGVSNGDVELATTDIQELEYVFEDLVIGQTYYVKVEAYDNQSSQIFSSSEILEIAFDTTPMIENLVLQANPDLSIGLSGILYPFGSDLTYHVAYGQDRNSLSLRTDSVAVSADSSSAVIDLRIANLERFSTWHAVVVIEREGYAPLRSDTLSATLAFPTFVFGTPSTAANGNVSVPLTVDNGGFDTQVWLAGVNSDTTAVDGSNEPVDVTLVIPNPGIGVRLQLVALADTDGLLSRSDTLTYTTNGPEFTFVRAFARQDYKGIFQAAVNPNGIATQIRFEWGAFGTFNRSSPNINLGDGTSVVDTTFVSTQDLFFNGDHVARLVVFGEGFEFISNTIHFNARIPGIGINDIRVISSDSVVVSVQINSQGIDTYARLAYGPVGSGYPDTTAAVAKSGEGNVHQFDMTLTGLESNTPYQVKLLVQDQADLNKIVVSNVSTFTTPAGTDVSFQQVAGSAIAFDAWSSRVEFANTAAITTFTSYTIQMWFKTDDATVDVQFLTSKGIEHMEIHLTGGDQSLRFIPRPGRYFDTPSNSIQSGVWTHLSATLDVENNLAKVYLNGIDMPLTATGENVGLPFVSFHSDATNLHIGQRTDNSFRFGGDIDEIRLWNTARTPLQVWDDMHNTTLSEYDPSLVFYAQLNEGTGGTTVDAASGVVGTLLDFEHHGWVTSTAPINNGARYSTQLNGIAGWRFLSSPVPTTVGQLLSGLWTQGFTGASTSSGASNVYTWNASNAQNSASNWTPVTNATQALAPGDALFVYVYDGAPGSAAVWPKPVSVTGQSLREVPSLTSRLNPTVDGWALVGNPYSTDIAWGDLSRTGLYNSVYSWDPNNEEWVTWNGTTGGLTGGRIGAFNGFLVATMNESPSLSLPFTARRAGPTQFLGKVAETMAATFSLNVEGPDGRSNKAWFSFDENGKLGLDAYDALKLAPYSANYVQLASVVNDSIRLDINHLPMLTDEVTIPLKLTSTANGTYRLSLNGNALPRGWDFAVIDTQTGESSKLAQPLEFTWTGGGKELSRFVLKLSPNTITSTERGPDTPLAFALAQNVPNPFNPTTVIRYTVDAGRPTSLKVYDMLGREVAVLVDGVMSAGTHSVTFDGSGLSSGVYLYRLESGGNVLSRKFTLIK